MNSDNEFNKNMYDRFLEKLKKIGNDIFSNDESYRDIYKINKTDCEKKEKEIIFEENKLMNEKNKNLKLSSPWQSYVDSLAAFFKLDPNVHINFEDSDDSNKKVYIRVEGTDKAEALEKLLPDKIDFGNVVLHICVIPANRSEKSRSELIEDALKGNPIFDGIIRPDVRDRSVNPLIYAMFKKDAAQYFNDNLGDPYGNETLLYADLAEYIFGIKEGVYFSTSPGFDFPDDEDDEGNG